ncbi:MAG: aldo/keto reductase [Cognatishimia sp.]
MKYNYLGRSGLKVSELGMGTMSFGGEGTWQRVGATDIADARRQIDLSIEAGINFFDTADIYSNGMSEEILGAAIGDKRKDNLIATKVRFPMGPGPNDGGLSRHHIIAECEASLKRLKTDWIDLYQLHQWDGQTPVEETILALDDLVRQGKVRYIGCSNYSAWHMMKALGTSERLSAHRFISQQIHYTLQAREAEYELIPAAIDQGVGMLIWSPLAGGLLSGKYRRDKSAPEGSRHLLGWRDPPVRDEPLLYDIVDKLVEIAEARDATPAQIALAWLLGRPGVSSVLVGARTEAQLVNNLKAVDIELSADERAALDSVSRPALLYPYWHQRNTISDRLSEADMALIGEHL